MKLHSGPFEMIKSGKKIYELRLYDEKRRLLSVGDLIEFTKNDGSGEKLTLLVRGLHHFADFRELYASLPLLSCGYTEQDIDTADASDMEEYYSLDQQAKYGVLGIELMRRNYDIY